MMSLSGESAPRYGCRQAEKGRFISFWSPCCRFKSSCCRFTCHVHKKPQGDMQIYNLCRTCTTLVDGRMTGVWLFRVGFRPRKMGWEIYLRNRKISTSNLCLEGCKRRTDWGATIVEIPTV